MNEPTRFEAADLRCKDCQKNTDAYGIMRSNDKGRWVFYKDYEVLRAEHEKLVKKIMRAGENLYSIARASISEDTRFKKAALAKWNALRKQL